MSVITPLPDPPQATDSPVVFRAKGFAFMAAWPQMVDEVNAFGPAVAQTPVDAAAAAAARTQSEAARDAAYAALGASTWVSGAGYAVGNIVFGINNPGTPYRCILAHSGVTTVPDVDTAHWVIAGAVPLNVLRTAPVVTRITAAATAVAGQNFDCDTSGGAYALTLPASPNVGDWIGINDYARTFKTNNLTLGRNGQNIEGLAENCDLDLLFRGRVEFRGGSLGWIFV